MVCEPRRIQGHAKVALRRSMRRNEDSAGKCTSITVPMQYETPKRVQKASVVEIRMQKLCQLIILQIDTAAPVKVEPFCEPSVDCTTAGSSESRGP